MGGMRVVRAQDNMQPQVLRVTLRAAVFCFMASGLVAIMTITLNSGFGAGDIGPFLFWTAPFVAGVAISSLVLVRLFSRLSHFASYLVAIFLGSISGILWFAALVTWFLNPWLGFFNFPVLACWMAGGASGMLSVAGIRSRARKGNTVIELALLVTLSSLFAFGTEPFIAWSTGDRQITFIFVRWQPDSGSMILANSFNALNEDEVAQLDTLA
jgi:hypothetical protein